jgi:hypothetical protein
MLAASFLSMRNYVGFSSRKPCFSGHINACRKCIQQTKSYVEKNDAGSVVKAVAGEWMVRARELSLWGKPHTCGKLRASSTRLVWGGGVGSSVKKYKIIQ